MFWAPAACFLEAWRSAADDQRGSWAGETGPASEPPSLIPPSRGPAEVGVGSALPLVSLEMIALPRGQERGGSPAPSTQDFHEKGTFYFRGGRKKRKRFLLKPTLPYPAVAFINPRLSEDSAQ